MQRRNRNLGLSAAMGSDRGTSGYSQYDMTGGSPLVKKQHGSMSDLHEGSPARS